MLFRRQVAIARMVPRPDKAWRGNGAVVVAVTVGFETPFLLAVHLAECK